MKIQKHLILTFLLIVLLSPLRLAAQSLPVGNPLEDYYRRQQLLGKLDSSISFTSRPFFQETRLEDWKTGRPVLTSSRPLVLFHLLPITWQQQFNSHHPYSLNDGGMIPARGYQSMVSAGFFAKIGPLSVQFQPEFVWAENKPFETFISEKKSAAQIGAFNSFNSIIDFPESFPGKPYNKAFLGQSSVRLTAGPVSIGVSTENLWWGPGMRNTIMMTNSAAGFNHFTLNTVKPIRTYVGSFEGQIIGGKLESSNTVSSENKQDDWRYLSGIVATYQPRWVPGLFLGATRTFLTYSKDIKSGIMGYFPVFQGVSKKSLFGEGEAPSPDDQRISAFIRWLLPKDHFEVYVEYGKEDHNFDMRDFLLQADHTRAYILGFRKLYPLNKNDNSYLGFNFEMTQMEQNLTNRGRASSYFYAHGELRQGYTQQGQMVGAGIGPGSNLQTASVSWYKGFKSLGVQVERYVHNNNLFYTSTGDIRAHWVDINLALLGEWNWKKLFFTAKLETIRSMNYAYNYEPIPGSDTSNFWNPGKDIYNFQVNIGTSYRF